MINKIYAISINFDPITGIGGFQTGGDPGTTLERFFTVLLGFFTTVGGLAFLIYFILGAFSYLTSSGDREKIVKAQRYITNAIIGLLLLILAWAITGIIGIMLGFDILNLSNLISSLYP